MAHPKIIVKSRIRFGKVAEPAVRREKKTFMDKIFYWLGRPPEPKAKRDTVIKDRIKFR